MRKAISLIVLNREQQNIAEYVSDSQSGFQKGRATADATWAQRFICARATHYREELHMLGIDLSRAFDTLSRSDCGNVCAKIDSDLLQS